MSVAFDWIKMAMQEVVTITTWLQRAWLSFRLIFEVLEKAVVSYFETFEMGLNWVSDTIKDMFGTDLGKSTFFSSWRQQTDKAIDETVVGINELTHALDTDAPARATGEWFDNIKKEAIGAAAEIEQIALQRREIAREASRTIERQDNGKKKMQQARSVPVGFAGQIQARGVSAEALRMSNKKTQVEDPQLKTTNLLLTDMNKNIKTIKTGSAVTV